MSVQITKTKFFEWARTVSAVVACRIAQAMGVCRACIQLWLCALRKELT